MGSGVRGDLLRWARVEQNLTMRWVHDNGGPCPSYQSEVENGKKREVLSDKLAAWTQRLNVTEAFACGQISKYYDEPSAIRGVAAEIGGVVTSGRSVGPNWTILTEQERVREVLRLIAHDCRKLPRVVLAWVLNLTPDTFDALLVGQHPVLRPHLEATMQLTTLPETFFTHGRQFEHYIPAFRRALECGLSPDDLLTLMSPPPSSECSGDGACGVQDDGPLGPGGGSGDNREEHGHDQQQPE